MTTLSSKTKDV